MNQTRYQNLLDIEKWAGNPGSWIEINEIVQFKKENLFYFFQHEKDGKYIQISMTAETSLLKPPKSDTKTDEETLIKN